ncbi:MAG TPA: glycosyltransferase family 4 protein [Chitinophagaceae bacterium]|nr:glycosyltransferase family 4 protein [Chitinophagaceae bacterium]HPH30267.1 glycosyltransferase family 4 protein [Chitinophagaceae bacterium]HPN57753.1 glycosyltransferase family 4 protein [Chitinophagaceae bacterium]
MKFCFWGDIADAILGKTIGGGEIQIAQLARALARQGHEVVIIDFEAEESFSTEEGIKVKSVPGWNKGIPGLKILIHQIPVLYRMLKAEKADYYYVRMRSYFNITSYLAARKNKAKFIVALAHDLDVAGFRDRFRYEYKSRLSLKSFFTLYLPNDLVFDYTIRRADFITLQHKGQRLLSRRFRGKQQVFENIFDLNKVKDVVKQPGDFYVMAGSLTIMKGIGNLLELVKRMDKSVNLVVIGEPRGKMAEAVYNELKKFPNVVLKGRLRHAETINYIASAKALVSTSNFEGFPNVFLEAWANGVPVMSLQVNPGNVIKEAGLGEFVNGDYEALAACMLANSTAAIQPAHLVNYINEHHSIEKAADKFLRFIGQPL